MNHVTKYIEATGDNKTTAVGITEIYDVHQISQQPTATVTVVS